VKQVRPHGELRQWCGKLVIPLCDDSGELRSLQFIGADGSKLFLSGGRVSGCFFTLPDTGTGALIVAEGYATAASIFEATGCASIFAVFMR
jgi:putative DNA primase/helicase